MITVASYNCPRCDAKMNITAANEWFQDIQMPQDCSCGLRWYLTTVGLRLSDRISIVFNTSEKNKEPNTTFIKRLHEDPKTSRPSSGITPGPAGQVGSGLYGTTGFIGSYGASAGPMFSVEDPNDSFTFDGLQWKITEEEANELMDRVHSLRIFT